MVRRLDRNILPMIAKIKDYKVVTIEKMPPIREIGISGKTISMREQDSNAIRIAVTPQPNLGAIIKVDDKGIAWSGKFKNHAFLHY